MKIQCDVCEKAPATLICCADEAALCAKCDVEVHAANKLASKHQRLLLHSLSTKLPRCDICQDKPAFIFCVEDRALFCQDCDEPIHSAGTISANHQRFLATGIRVASSSNCTKDNEKSHSEPSNRNAQLVSVEVPSQQVPTFTSSWAVDDLLELTDFESNDKESLQFGELEWLEEGLFGEQFPHEALAAAEVPQLPPTHISSNVSSYRTYKSYLSHKKPRIEVQYNDDDDEDEFFTVPDLG
ncbi:PREDICTED: B-box zinc finger protein 24-like isoform X2 [Lupinus angustifolius]|uniref:B-box zinc finger protein 24-like isoform X2 n=1 Tax=Lupinus angustifolius TaxID=3871 RepID=UPI00092F1FD6|nr:PREDICTED: B-box zinc finger protein 24-like isoform X2 [Lupinus angustifolius]